MLRLLVLFAGMAAFSKQLMKQNIFRVLLSLAIAAVALLRAENLSRVVNRATPEILVREALEKNPELNFYAAGIAAAKGGLKPQERFGIRNSPRRPDIRTHMTTPAARLGTERLGRFRLIRHLNIPAGLLCEKRSHKATLN